MAHLRHAGASKSALLQRCRPEGTLLPWTFWLTSGRVF